MEYQMTIRPLARRNLAAIERWYDAQGEGLSDRFRLEFKATLDRIHRLPFSTPLIYKQTRRIEMNIFPYAVLYCVEESEIFILKVVHVKRHPKRFNISAHGNGIH
jgi:toxin ParE1/3/4